MEQVATLEEIKNYIKVDDDFEDELINNLSLFAYSYIESETGKEYGTLSKNYQLLFKHCLLMLVLTSYENRSALNINNSDKKGLIMNPFIEYMLFEIALKG